MTNKKSHMGGFGAGFYLGSGNPARLQRVDDNNPIYVTQGASGTGAAGNHPWTKTYLTSAVTDVNFNTLPSAPPTGLAAIAEGFVNGLPVWVAITNSTTTTSGAVMRSTDHGNTWVAGTLPGAPGGAWTGLAFGNGVFVAVANSTSTTAGIAYSYDGVTWAFATISAPNAGWVSVAFGGVDGDGCFVAVCADNTAGTASIYSSLDGITWTGQTAPSPAGNWTDAAWGNPLGDATGLWVFTALGTDASTTVYTSVPTAGTLATFTALTLPDAPLTTGPISVAYSPLANLVNGPGATSVTYTGIFSIIAANKTAASVGVMWTFDGTTVLSVLSPAMAPSSAWLKVRYGQGRFFAINGSTATNDALITSTDGINWTYVTLPSAPGGAWKNIAVGDQYSGYVMMVANAATTGTSLASSIVGPAIMVEYSTGNQAEGVPDLFITGNQNGYYPDISRKS